MVKFEGDYEMCLGVCKGVYHEKELRNGYCQLCAAERSLEAEKIVAKANGTALTVAAQKLLAQSMASKNEPIAPDVLAGFGEAIGGWNAYGKMLKEDLDKARGVGIKPSEAGAVRPDPKNAVKIHELISRIYLANDQREDGGNGLGSLTEEELANTLRSLSLDLVRTNEEYRRIAAIEAVKYQPELIHELMSIAGLTIEGEVKLNPLVPPDLLNAGMDEKEAFDGDSDGD